MTAGGSAAAHAAAIRAGARRGPWRRFLSWVGCSPAVRRADAQAAAWGVGAAGEEATAALLRPLEREGWTILHDRALPGSRANLDHVLVSPCGTAVVVLDTKRWHRGMPTTLVRGRVHCGGEDRHGQVEALARYAQRAGEAIGRRGVRVWPLLVVHGSPIPGGRLEARVPGWDRPMHVLGPGFLIPTLRGAPKRYDPGQAARLASHVGRALPPYGT